MNVLSKRLSDRLSDLQNTARHNMDREKESPAYFQFGSGMKYALDGIADIVGADAEQLVKMEQDSFELINRNVYMRVLVRLALDNLRKFIENPLMVPGYKVGALDVQDLSPQLDAAITLLEEIERRQARDWPAPGHRPEAASLENELTYIMEIARCLLGGKNDTHNT